MLAFTVAVFFLLITPGPGVLSVAGVGAAFGPGPGTRYLVGLCVGSNAVIGFLVDLTRIAVDESPDVPAMNGWRRMAFGDLALQLKRGEIALGAGGDGIEIVEFED